MVAWLNRESFEWIVFLVLMGLIFLCFIWRLHHGTRGDHHRSREN